MVVLWTSWAVLTWSLWRGWGRGLFSLGECRFCGSLDFVGGADVVFVGVWTLWRGWGRVGGADVVFVDVWTLWVMVVCSL